MSTTAVPTAPPAVTRAAADVLARQWAYASVAHGTAHGYYRMLFEAGPVDAAAFAAIAGVSDDEARSWLGEQLELGLLRPVRGPEGRPELLLPAEYVPVLLDDHGQSEFAAARLRFAEHADELPEVLRTLWASPIDPDEQLPRGVSRLWARMFQPDD
ncbi:hypothetical protein GCM10009819_24070 [Agromyces tropicus]|uniref:Uncharacterized protein n=1 Tax=Agromyces tropicus TaxID=555371 RepID=A0ABN2UJH6_9MICO